MSQSELLELFQMILEDNDLTANQALLAALLLQEIEHMYVMDDIEEWKAIEIQHLEEYRKEYAKYSGEMDFS